MIILGVAFLSDASACLLRDGRVIAAVSEERLNRVKLWNGVPHKAIAEVLRIGGITLDQVDVVATHGHAPASQDRAPYEAKAAAIAASGLDEAARERQLAVLWSRYDHECVVLGKRTPAYLAEVAALGRPVKAYGHHQAHAATAFFATEWPDALILTADGWGEDASHTLSRASGLGIERIARSNTFDSLGYFYGSVTKALGFVPHRHEGKVLGLAANCLQPKSYATLRQMVDADLANNRFVGRMEGGLYTPRFDNEALKAFVAGFPREDVAAGVQTVLEEVICAHVRNLGTAARRLGVAGGIFANVKLNQRLAELPDVEELRVFPNMGDGGLSVGAAWLAHAELTGQRPEPWQTCYLGHAPDDASIVAALEAGGLAYRRSANVQDEIGALLAAGKVVARCTGAMEFGPRALGHRSILYHAREPDVNRWLNDRLKRSEFMPFAPATLEEEADLYYVNLDPVRAAARYMTVTCDCTPLMKQEAPAAVHVDGTARPQLVGRATNPDFHGILTAYRARTGQPTVINTSFNMHEEPIVCTAEDAVRAYTAGALDVLALGDYIAVREDSLLGFGT
jgi:carbamoyltransferase